MRKTFLIARANVRKAKGQTIAIVALILITALLLNLWLILSLDYTANFDRYHDKLNAQHVTLSISGENETEIREFLTETLRPDSRVSQFALDDCMSMAGTFPYNNGQMNGWFIFLEKDAALSREIGRAEITEAGTLTSGVYLPLIYKSDDIQVGDRLEITVGGSTIEYTVCGFFNSVMLGSHNCSLTEIILSADKYEELIAAAVAPQATLCSVRLADKTQNQNFEAEFGNSVFARFPTATIMTNSYDNVLQARYISQMICSGVISAMAFFVLLIALVVIAANIINYVQVNMQNLGVLKAAGYTSAQLVGALLMQFLTLTAIAAVVGVALSYCLFPAVNAMMVSQTGIPYAVTFLPLQFVIVLAVLCGAVALSVWVAARRIKRIEPIVALRSGTQTHNFKKNRVPLDKTKAPLNFALALKTTLSGMKHNVTVCITMLVVSLVVVFSGLMTENMIVNMQPFIDLIVGEMPESCVNVNTDVEEEFLQLVNTDGRVEKVYLYNSLVVTHDGGTELVATISDDFSKANNQSIVFEGRFPKFDNEIALAAKYSRETGLRIGDEIELAVGGKKATYLICGYTQISNQLGKDCLITREGYERLAELANASYYMNLTEGVDIDEFNAEMQERFGANANMVINGVAAIESMATVYTSLMTVLVIAILVLSAIIIAFVLYLLVRTLLNNRKRDFGIMKALGYTTGQLVLQTAMSFMPSIILSTIVGLMVSAFVINPLTALFLSGIGIVKCTFTVPVGFTVAAGAGLILLSFGILCLLSLRIKKITPRNLLAGE